MKRAQTPSTAVVPGERKCPRCGSTMGGFGPEGLCGKCMFDSALKELPEEEALETSSAALRRFGDYELLEEIARGGMGVVFKARQISLNRIVAVKMILSGELAGVAELARFRAEAKAAGQLQHPNIVAIHEVGEHEGQPFFSMDYVEGKNLGELARNEPLPARRAAGYLKTIAEAVEYAHSRGVLHRDLKPSNILIDHNDQPRITDFGLAKRITTSDFDPRTSDLTLTGQVMGSPNFMPPEQAAGEREKVSPASDVYSLGAILYQLLTGRPPFAAETLTQTLRMLAETDPFPPRLLSPAMPKDLETVCLKCLQKSPQSRYTTARDLADDLKHFLADEAIVARPVSQGEKVWRWCRRHPAVSALSVAVLGLLITVAVSSTIHAARLKEALRESYFGQARAERYSGHAGRRFKALELLGKAADIRRAIPTIDIRNEAIACLALTDLETHAVLKSPTGHELSFDRNYDRSVSLENDGYIVVRRVTDKAELSRIPAPANYSGSWLSPNGKFLLVNCGETESKLFQVYDVGTRQPILTRSNEYVRNFLFTPSGQELILALGNPSKIVRYSLPAGQEQVLISLPVLVGGLALSPSGDRLAIASDLTQEVQVRDTTEGKLVALLPHPAYVRGIAWHPDGRILATGCADNNIYLWDTFLGKQIRVLTGHISLITQIGFTDDGNYLDSISWDSSFRLWDPWTGQQLLTRPACGVLDRFSSGGRIAIRSPTTIDICDLIGGREWRVLYPRFVPRDGGIDCAWSPEGRILVSRDRSGLRFWDITMGREIAAPLAGVGQIRDVAFDPSGSNVVAATSMGLCRWPTHWAEGKDSDHWVLGEVARIRPDVIAESVAFPGSGKILATAAGAAVRILEWPSGRESRLLTLGSAVFAWALSPSGRFCAAWPAASKAPRRVWDVATGAVLKDLPSDGIYGAAFTPDDRLLITGSAVECVAWDTRFWTNTWKAERENSGNVPACIALTRDGKLGALTLSADKIRLFEPSTGRELATLEAPQPRTINWLEFSADGGKLAVINQTSSIQIWDLRLIRQELAEMKLDWEAPQIPPGGPAGRPIHLDATMATNILPSQVPIEIPLRDPKCDTHQIDLSGFYNGTLAKTWEMYPGNDLVGLTPGCHAFSGVAFDIRGVVHLAGIHVDGNYPPQVLAVPIRQRSRAIHFLHAFGWEVIKGTEIGAYVVHFEDGQTLKVPLTAGENIWNWWVSPDARATLGPDTEQAWTGSNDYARKKGYNLALFKFRWANPRPQVEITEVDFESAATEASPFLIAITVE